MVKRHILLDVSPVKGNIQGSSTKLIYAALYARCRCEIKESLSLILRNTIDTNKCKNESITIASVFLFPCASNNLRTIKQ